MHPLFTYYWLSARYPTLKDYVDMGLGIEARYQRCKHFWKHHIEACKKFQRTQLQDLEPHASIGILGAGRLLDLDDNLIQQRKSCLSLYDADPSCCFVWKRLGFQPPQFEIADLSLCLQTWTSSLNSFLKRQDCIDIPGLCSFLSALQPPPSALPKNHIALISLNLLSQIPVYWRERVLVLLKKYWKLKNPSEQNLDSKLQSALHLSLGKLQEQHLELLEQSQAKRILLITDTDFHYYVSSHPEWQSESALFLTRSIHLRGYQMVADTTWLWDIAPQGIEQREYGVIHQVRALAFEK